MSDEIEQDDGHDLSMSALFADYNAARNQRTSEVLGAVLGNTSDKPDEPAAPNAAERAALAGMAAKTEGLGALLYPSEAQLADQAEAQRIRDEERNAAPNRRGDWTDVLADVLADRGKR